jgi:hypothetical protein
MPIDPIYNMETEFDRCMDDLDKALDVLVYTRLALDLKLKPSSPSSSQDSTRSSILENTFEHIFLFL